MRVLVIEDDPKIARFVAQGLEAESHQVDTAGDGESGLERAVEGGYDLVLLDLNLPKLDGFSLLNQLRASRPALPVIAVTARAEIQDRVRGLDEGADDYLVKPFSFDELSARIRALFRRAGSPQGPELRSGDLILDRLCRTLGRGEASVPLSTREFQLMELFMRHPGEPLTRSMIAERVWGYTFDTGTNVIDVYVNYVRKKLKELGLEPIQTLRGIGYMFAQDEGA